MTRITFISKIDFETMWNKEPPTNSVCISINDPTTASLPCLDPRWKHSLMANFYDYDTEELSGFNEELARKICEFVDFISETNPSYIVIHCYAGISRSAAVAKFVSTIMNLKFPEHYTLYNKFVFNTLIKYWNHTYIHQ